MPKQKTFDLLAQLEVNNDFNTIDVYIFTANENENHIYNAYKHRIRGWIVKPEKQDELNQVVQTLADYWSMSRRPNRAKTSVHEISTRSHMLK